MTSPSTNSQPLNELWFNRPQLNEPQWSELYQLILSILKPYKPSLLDSLSLEHEDYIQQFFIEKVLLTTATTSTGNLHAGAIRAFYKNFLTSQLRSATETKNKKTESLDNENFVEKSEYQINSQSLDNNWETLLEEQGLSMQTVSQHAQVFYQQLDRWAQHYLSLHFCPEAHDVLPLNALAKRYQISSYHYKAGLLGITRKKTDRPHDFHKTLLGDWLINTLKIPSTPENSKIWALILKILCVTALSQ